MLGKLFAYLREDEKLQKEEKKRIDDLSREEKIEKGWIIPNAKIIENFSTEGYAFSCSINNSKLKSGDSVLFIGEKNAYSAEVIDNNIETIELHVYKNFSKDIPVGLSLEKNDVYIEKSVLVSKVIEVLNIVNKNESSNYLKLLFSKNDSFLKRKEPLTNYLIDNEINGRCNTLCESQYEAIKKVLQLPSLLAIQGPPGTGKTHVMSITADILTTCNKPVLILAPTHQAVNNALNAILELNPSANVFKIGNRLKSQGCSDKIIIDSAKKICNNLRSSKYHNNAIVGMTYLSALYQKGTKHLGFEPSVALIDEAGQLPLAQGAVADIIGVKSLILYGDDAQMSPVYTSGTEDKPFSVSLFSHIRELYPKCIHVLDTTYRMNGEICKYVGERFYTNSEKASFLIPANPNQKLKVTTLPNDAPDWIKRVLLNDSSISIIDDMSDSDCIQKNPAEAIAIAELVKYSLDAGLRLNELAVVSPYRKQVSAIKNAIKKLGIEKCPIIDTVERVQGISVRMIIISQPTTDSEALKENSDFVFNKNRINVAFSRAKQKVVAFNFGKVDLF